MFCTVVRILKGFLKVHISIAGWRIRKSYIMVKPLKEPKVKQILSWVSYSSYYLILERIKAAVHINFKQMLGQSFWDINMFCLNKAQSSLKF